MKQKEEGIVNLSMGLLVGIMLILFSVSTIVIGCYLKNEKAFLIIKRIFVYLSPVVSLICVELITGSIQTIETVYWVKNLFLYYIAFLVLFLFLKFQVTGVIYSAILIVLALLYHYVLVFRGRPFVLWDIFSWKTALTVVGAYHFDITAGILVSIFIWIVFSVVLMIGKKVTFSIKTRMGSLMVCLTLFGIFLLTNNKFVIDFNTWDVEGNYKNMGLIYTFIVSVK